MKHATLVVLALVSLVACDGDTIFPRCDDPKHPCPPVEPDYPASDRDGLGTPIGDACDRLRRMGCPEGFRSGKDRTCFESYTAASRLASVPSACIRSSVTQGEVRACGDARSVRVRCVLPSVGVAGSAAP
jgi:hypothetical protein